MNVRRTEHSSNSQQSLLAAPERHPLIDPAQVSSLGFTIVIAPHPDDETLGCGGLLALLEASGNRPHVVVMTDGSRSHPRSKDYPAAKLAALRERETRAALAVLGIPPQAATFMRYRDGGLPASDTPAFRRMAHDLGALFTTLRPATLLVPWRSDLHQDHEATWRLVRAAAATATCPPRWLEYPIWAWTRTDSYTAPRTGDYRAWRFDISMVLALKQDAIAQHRSQLGELVRDDPDGCVLEPSFLEHFARPWELFMEPRNG